MPKILYALCIIAKMLVTLVLFIFGNTQHMKYLSITLFLALTAIFFFSCEKDDDIEVPVVEILKPIAQSVYQVYDSIYVDATVKDNSNLSSIQVTLVNKNHIPVDHSVNIGVYSNPQQFNVYYHITNKYLETGDYLLEIRASDGANTKFKYREVRVIGLPKILENVIMIQNDNQGYTVHTFDTLNQISQKALFTETYGSSALNNTNEHLYVCSPVFEECYALYTSDFTIDFQLLENGSPDNNYHQLLYSHSDRFYLGLTEGYVKGYDKYGSQLFNANLPTGRVPGEMLIHDDYLIVAEREENGPERYIVLYHLASGSKWFDYQISDNTNVVKLEVLDNDRILIFGNKNGNGTLMQYNIQNNTGNIISGIPSGMVHDVCKIDSGTFMMAHDNGLLTFNAVNNTTYTFVSPLNVSICKYDPYSKLIFAGHNKDFFVYEYDTKVLRHHANLLNNLLELHIQYSK